MSLTTEEHLRQLLETERQQRKDLDAICVVIQELAYDYWAAAYNLKVGNLIKTDVVQRIEFVVKWANYLSKPLIKCSRWLDTQKRWSKTTVSYYPNYCPKLGPGSYTVLSAEEASAFFADHQEASK